MPETGVCEQFEQTQIPNEDLGEDLDRSADQLLRLRGRVPFWSLMKALYRAFRKGDSIISL